MEIMKNNGKSWKLWEIMEIMRKSWELWENHGNYWKIIVIMGKSLDYL